MRGRSPTSRSHRDHDFSQGAQAAEAVSVDLGKAGHDFLDGGQNFHPLDAVDAQVGFQRHVGAEGNHDPRGERRQLGDDAARPRFIIEGRRSR